MDMAYNLKTQTRIMAFFDVWDVKPGMVDYMVDLIIVDFLQAVHHAGDTLDTYAQHAYRAF